MDLNIEPLEELVVTTKTIHEKIGRDEVDTLMTRRKGLHWLTDMSGARVLVDESATMNSGPRLGTTLCFTLTAKWRSARKNERPTGSGSGRWPPK